PCLPPGRWPILTAPTRGRMTPQTAVNIEDLRGMARRRVPRAVFDYIDGGAEAEATLRENRRAFETLSFRPRHAVPVGGCDLKTRVLGHDLALPFLLAPVGYSRLMHPQGECAAARAAGEAGTGYILSTISGHRLEDVRAASKGPLPMRDVAPSLTDSCFVWQDLAWIRKAWPGPFIIKGVLTGEDARRAVDEGAAAVVVSNHGGRQLDSAPATVRVLPEVVAAV